MNFVTFGSVFSRSLCSIPWTCQGSFLTLAVVVVAAVVVGTHLSDFGKSVWMHWSEAKRESKVDVEVEAESNQA